MGVIWCIDGVVVECLEQNMDGWVIVVFDYLDELCLLIVEFDCDVFEWKIIGKLFSLFWFLLFSFGLCEFYMGRNVLLVNIMSYYEVLLWLYFDEELVSVFVNVVYYLDDWGLFWCCLDIVGYFGVFGFDEVYDWVFWVCGNWYDSCDFGVQVYDLD